MTKPDPIHKADETARNTVRELVENACFGALAVLRNGSPHVSRIAVALGPDNLPMTLLSDLAIHTQALAENPNASLLLGEPKDRGDPLTHPRVTIQINAEKLSKTQELTQLYLQQHPKAKLYINFGDFNLYRLAPIEGFLNAGFGKAYHLTAQDFA